MVHWLINEMIKKKKWQKLIKIKWQTWSRPALGLRLSAEQNQTCEVKLWVNFNIFIFWTIRPKKEIHRFVTLYCKHYTSKEDGGSAGSNFTFKNLRIKKFVSYWVPGSSLALVPLQSRFDTKSPTESPHEECQQWLEFTATHSSTWTH